jgi:hypothetical protein
MEPMEGTAPISASRSPYLIDVNCPGSMGRRNTG